MSDFFGVVAGLAVMVVWFAIQAMIMAGFVLLGFGLLRMVGVL